MKYLLTFFATLLLTGCGIEQWSQTKVSDSSIWQLHFMESEPGIEPYPVRMIISERYLRLDDGHFQSDYILFDRYKRQIHSVSHEDQSILQIFHRPVTIASPIPLSYSHDMEVDEQAPLVEEKRPRFYDVKVNAERCYQVVAVEGIMEMPLAVMGDYLKTLAGEQALNLENTPADMQTACMLGNLIFSPLQHLQFGFPIYEKSYNGYERQLIDYTQLEDIADDWYEIPLDYRAFSINSQ